MYIVILVFDFRLQIFKYFPLKKLQNDFLFYSLSFSDLHILIRMRFKLFLTNKKVILTYFRMNNYLTLKQYVFPNVLKDHYVNIMITWLLIQF